MRHFETTSQFYRSKEWEQCKQQVIQRELEKSTDAVIRCGLCGEPIVKGFNPNDKNNKGAIVFHHKIYLNNFNVNDASISINPDNIMVLHWSCHNEIHKRFGQGQVGNRIEKKVYLYGFLKGEAQVDPTERLTQLQRENAELRHKLQQQQSGSLVNYGTVNIYEK